MKQMTNELSVEDAINYFERSYANGDTDDERQHNEALDMAIKALERSSWIPCSERLPEENGNYLVTVEANDGTASIKYQTVEHYGPKWLHDEKTRKVIAWQPLPEKYEESEGMNDT